MISKTKSLKNTLLWGITAMTLFACAEQRSPVNRVQPLALEKTFFVGEDLIDPGDNPEFWSQGTLVDVGYGAAQSGLFTSTYAQPMSRIRWQITEDLLIARLAYERIDGSDGKGRTTGKFTEDGTIVAAFQIESHFDISREYNPTTGEKLNIIVENNRDRPWNERKYLRVDWSTNLSTDNYDFDTLSLLGIYGGVEYEPLHYYVEDPQDDDAPVFDVETGYFDVTNKAFATPQQIDLSSRNWGIDNFPACMLGADFLSGSAPAASCSPVELTIRQSFRKVEDYDYEPVDWDGFRFQAAGAFFVERDGFDRNRGMLDNKHFRFLSRYNIWQRSHYYDDPDTMSGPVECNLPEDTLPGSDPRADEDGDGTHDICAAAGSGSHCDIYSRKCTLPYRERKSVTIPWYYTKYSNPLYFEATELATHQWDVALRHAAQAARYTECVRTTDNPQKCKTTFPVHDGQQTENDDAIALALEVDDCRNGIAYPGEAECEDLADKIGATRRYSKGVIALAKLPEMIVLCHSPVLFTDQEACGKARLPQGMTVEDCILAREERDGKTLEVCNAATNVRRGDLRYHQVNVLTEPQTPSPWGIYTDAEDPLTGETISASINVWSHITDLWSQQVVDTLRYVNGELATESITEGQYVTDFPSLAEGAMHSGVFATMDHHQVENHLSSFTGLDEKTRASLFEDLKKKHPEILKVNQQIKQKIQNIRASSAVTPSSTARTNARLRHARGTEFEAELMTKSVRQAAGVDSMPLSDAVMDIASPLRGANPTVVREIERLKQNALAARGACIMHEADAPLSMHGLGKMLEVKFGPLNKDDDFKVQATRAEQMRRYVAERAHMSVIVHEMGHSVGMRHNFVSSSDAFGFRPQYWQLRTNNGKTKDICQNLTQDGDSCVGPRYFDPVSDNERDNLIWMFMHSSVMEYAGETTQDFLGLGVYDFHAARMFYGDVATVHADDSYKVLHTHPVPEGLDEDVDYNPKSNEILRSVGMLAKTDNFGGIMGMTPAIGTWQFDTTTGYWTDTITRKDVHYSTMNHYYDLITDCWEVDPNLYKPARYDPSRFGEWSPLLDGQIVKVKGKYTRCAQQKVDYVAWDDLRMPTEEEFPGAALGFRGDRGVDKEGRTRVPYGLGSDEWADLGNLSVYRHDNGADPYEILNFFITVPEVYHIFDNYRRGRAGFSIRKASSRSLHRFAAKARDGAKGLSLIKNIYRQFSAEIGYSFDDFWPIISSFNFKDNILASGLVFDNFTRLLARPQAGPHVQHQISAPMGSSNSTIYNDQVLRSSDSLMTDGGQTQLLVPNGATGYFGNVSPGGRLVENRLSNNQGDYDREYTMNCGSYYDKMNTAMLMTESVDNFISDSLDDFVDARYRAVSLADLFPDGYRRWLGNNLTGDDWIKGVRVAVDARGTVLTDEEGYPTYPLGYTSWWGKTPSVCFPGEGTTVCSVYGDTSETYGQRAPEAVAVIDPQVGWEQQKFLIAWTLLYLPENQHQKWIDQVRIWELGIHADPAFENRIEFHYPTGRIFVAKTSGKETIFGREVQKGVAARVLEYANSLLEKAYDVEDGPDLDGDGVPEWYLPRLDPQTGQPTIKFDPSMFNLTEQGNGSATGGVEGCNETDWSECTCSDNRACLALEKYVSVPFFIRQTLDAYGLDQPSSKAIYN